MKSVLVCGQRDVAFQAVAELALRAGLRAAGNSHQVASNGVEAVLEVEIENRETGTSTHRARNP